MSKNKSCLIERFITENPEQSSTVQLTLESNASNYKTAKWLQTSYEDFDTYSFQHVYNVVSNHRSGICGCFGENFQVANLLSPTKTGTHKDAPSRGNLFTHPTGWEPRIKLDSETGAPAEITSIAVPSETPQNEALKETLSEMGVALRDDQEAILVEIRQGVDWFREEQGDDAVSRPSTRLRWVVRFKSESLQTGVSEEEVADLIAEATSISKRARNLYEVSNRALIDILS